MDTYQFQHFTRITASLSVRQETHKPVFYPRPGTRWRKARYNWIPGTHAFLMLSRLSTVLANACGQPVARWIAEEYRGDFDSEIDGKPPRIGDVDRPRWKYDKHWRSDCYSDIYYYYYYKLLTREMGRERNLNIREICD